MSKSAVNCRKSYVDHSEDRSKPTCIIHGPGNSSDECKVLGDFGSKYSKIRPTKDRGKDPATVKKLNSQQENNAIVDNAVKKILPQENNKVISEEEAH